MISFFYIIITLFFDSFYNSITNYSYYNLSFFTPMLIIVSLVPLYFLIKNKRIYLFLAVLLGILTDILYNEIFVNIYLYLLISLITIIYYRKRKINLINIILITFIILIVYDSFLFLILNLINYSTYTINALVYKISHSIILNILYIVISYFVLYKSLKKKIKDD